MQALAGCPPVCLLTVFVCVGLLSADREVQRILLELLNQMDGFDQNVNVKVSGLGRESEHIPGIIGLSATSAVAAMRPEGGPWEPSSALRLHYKLIVF